MALLVIMGPAHNGRITSHLASHVHLRNIHHQPSVFFPPQLLAEPLEWLCLMAPTASLLHTAGPQLQSFLNSVRVVQGLTSQAGSLRVVKPSRFCLFYTEFRERLLIQFNSGKYCLQRSPTLTRSRILGPRNMWLGTERSPLPVTIITLFRTHQQRLGT